MYERPVAGKDPEYRTSLLDVTDCTCILHLMSSIGVSISETDAPLIAPQISRAIIGSFSSVL